MKSNAKNLLRRSLGLLIVLVMLVSLMPMFSFAAVETTIRVTANADRENNPTIVSVYSRASKYFTEHTSYPLTYQKTEGGYDIYTTTNGGIVEAFIPGETDKVVTTVAAGGAVTLDLPTFSAWEGGRYSADMYTNLDDSGSLNLTPGDSFALDTFRVWQALGGAVTENNFVEPGFHFEVFGDGNITIERIGGPGREQLKITAESAGVSVIKITYGAVTYNGFSYSSIDPRNTYAVAVNVGDGADFDTGFNTASGVTVRNDFDTFYFDNKESSLDFTFTPEANSTVRVHAPLNEKTWGEGWTNGTEDNGAWTIPLTDGRNIIEITGPDGQLRYQLVKARGVTVTVNNLSTPGEDLAVGETARITITGIESPIVKMAGLYNPGYTQRPYLNYKAGVTTVKSDTSSQYEPLMKVFTIDYTLNDADENVLSGGQIQGAGGFWGVGLGLNAHRNIPLEGVGASIGLGPDMGEIFFGALPKIELTVDTDRSAISPFTEDGWLIIDCGTGGTNASNSLTQKIRDAVGADNLDTVTKLKITGTMNNWDFYNASTMNSAYGALNSGNSNSRPAQLTELVELDLSEVTTNLFPNQALRRIMSLEKLRLPADFDITNHAIYGMPNLITVAFGDAPYIDGVIDLTGYTGDAVPAHLFGRYFSDPSYITSTATKVVMPGELDILQNAFQGLDSLQEIIFTGDTLGSINTTISTNNGAFYVGIKNTAVAYIPDNVTDTSELELYFDNIKKISEYPSDPSLSDARDALSVVMDSAKLEHSTNPGYSEHSWEALQKAISDAETILTYEDYMLSSEALAATGAAIDAAIDCLTPDKEPLKEALSESSGKIESDWSEESWAPFAAALAAAQAAYYDKAASLEDITAALEALVSAEAELATPLGNVSWLLSYIEKYENAVASDFTASSNFAALESAIAAAKAVAEMPAPTVSEVNLVEETLNTALNNVVYIADLGYEIDSARALEEAKYTSTTWNALKNALTSAEAVLSKANATTAEVNAAEIALRQAAMSLVFVGSSGGGGGGAIKSITVTFRLIGDSQHDEFDKHEGYVTWIATRSYTFNNVDRISVYDLFTRALDEAGLGYKGAESDYISAIQAPSVLGGYWLSEFDNGPNSGWMYTVDGMHPDQGLKNQYIYDGNAVIWHYTDDHILETNFEGNVAKYPNRWLEAKDVNPSAGSSSSIGSTATETVVDSEIKLETKLLPDGKVEAEAKTADIKKALDEVKKALETDTTAVGEIKLLANSESAANSVSVTLTAEAAKAVAEADARLAIDAGIGAVTLDSNTLSSLTNGTPSDAVISVTIEKVEKAELNENWQSVVEDNPVFNLSVNVDGKNVESFGGTVTVFLPYEGANASAMTVYHLANDGTVTAVQNAKYDAARRGFVFTTNHFSLFFISTADTMQFEDVSAENWFYDAVKYVYEKNLMNGVTETHFSPNTNLTRAMIVTILYRYDGEPAPLGASVFSDVTSGAWYANAVLWAAENKIVSGYGGGLFGPSDDITREQLATILYNYAKWKNLDVSRTSELSAYSDASEISAWATPAMKWATAEGLITGRTQSNLAPTGTATRAEAATILMRFIEEFVAK